MNYKTSAKEYALTHFAVSLIFGGTGFIGLFCFDFLLLQRCLLYGAAGVGFIAFCSSLIFYGRYREFRR